MQTERLPGADEAGSLLIPINSNVRPGAVVNASIAR
jgi:hypothetical protein